jgi:hypothetical protein
MRRSALALICVALSSCATEVKISGPFAGSASEAESARFRQLVASRPPEIERADWGHLTSISFERPNRAKVELANSMFFITFVVLKRAGEWRIDKKTIYTEVQGWVGTS